MTYCRLIDADIYLYEDSEGVVCFGKNGHQAWGMTKKEAIEHVKQHRRDGDYVPEYVDIMLQAEYIDELETQLALKKSLIDKLVDKLLSLTNKGDFVDAARQEGVE